MIEIDGSQGGGQILRTSLALSAVTGEPFKIENIRKNRSNPGLRPQHLKGVQGCEELCNAEVSGAKLNSDRLVFKPDEIREKKINVRIDTAGSIGLLFQTLFLPSSEANKDLKIDVKGGSTFSKWSPPVQYIQNILLFILKKLNFVANIEIERHGFYPKGGARVKAEVKPWREKKGLEMTERGDMKGIKGFSIASKHLRSSKVADRQKKEAHRIIADEFPSLDIDIKSKYVDSISPGSGIVLWAEFENTVLGSDSIGEKGKRSEKVGREASEELLNFIRSGSCFDKYIGDQILPFLALSSEKSRFTVSKVTDHIRTNLRTIEKFLDINFEVKDNKIRIEP